MTAPIEVKATLPKNRQHVKFKNAEGIVITYAKAAVDAKNFREAAQLLGGIPGARAKALAKWLDDLAGQFDKP